MHLQRTMGLAVIICGVFLTACGEDEQSEETGEVQVTVYGESFIEEGIPAEEMADDWSIEFDSFTVELQDIVVGGVTTPAAEPIEISGETDGAGHLLVEAEIPVGTHEGPRFVIAEVEVSGSATDGDTTKTFDWTFDHLTHYEECETTTEVVDGESSTFQITIHADHFFYDSLVSEDPDLVFQALADADENDDGEITPQELGDRGIGSYDVGNNSEIDNLWAWLVAQSQTLGHVDGEGHCDAHGH